jgi:hypothetical protein
MRDLDKVMAEVMGWTLVKPEDIGLHRSNPSAYYEQSPENAANFFVMNDCNWRPSTNIEQAFMLVEKMLAGKYTFVLNTYTHSHNPRITDYDARFSTPNKDGKGMVDFNHISTNPAEAICQAIHETIKGDL